MKFTLGQRVLIIPEARCAAPPPPTVVQRLLAGRTCVVTRLRQKNDSAWLLIDGEPHPQLGKEVLAFPNECVLTS